MQAATATAPISEPVATVERRFNDDLLLADVVRQQALDEYPTIEWLLEFPELRDRFNAVDGKAKSAKESSQCLGFLAVTFACLALSAAAVEHIWAEVPTPWPRIIGLLTALLGVLSAAIAAGGVLHGERKREWLRDRYLTERLRQLHFQWFLGAVHWLSGIGSEIADSEANKFQERRKLALARLLTRHDGHAAADLGKLIDPSESSEPWLYAEDNNVRVSSETTSELRDVFRAYRELRFEAQIDYCNAKLSRFGGGMSFFSLPLRIQQRMLGSIWLFAFLSLVLVHIITVGSGLLYGQRVHNAFIPGIIIILAIVALAAKTLQEGLALSREIERYEDYRAMIYPLIHRFDAAETNRERVDVMREMERLSFEEMRSFLRAHDESSFVI